MNDYKIGQKIWFTHKGKQHEATIIRVNQKTVSFTTKSGMSGRIGYGLIESKQGNPVNETPFENFVRNPLKDNIDLFEVLTQVSEKYHKIFETNFSKNEMHLLDNISVRWNRQYTYAKLGHYNYIKNEIMISQSIKFSPKYVIEHILFHELLHIRYHNHGSMFRSLEQQCDRYHDAKDYEHKLCLEIRHHGVNRLKRLPITPFKTKTKKPIKKETPKEEPTTFTTPTGLVLDLTDKWDRKFYEMNYTKK